MQVCTLPQTDNHASTPPLKFFYRSDAQPTASKHWWLNSLKHWSHPKINYNCIQILLTNSQAVSALPHISSDCAALLNISLAISLDSEIQFVFNRPLFTRQCVRPSSSDCVDANSRRSDPNLSPEVADGVHWPMGVGRGFTGSGVANEPTSPLLCCMPIHKLDMLRKYVGCSDIAPICGHDTITTTNLCEAKWQRFIALTESVGLRNVRMITNLLRKISQQLTFLSTTGQTAQHRILELIPVLCIQPAGDVSHKPGHKLPLLSARPTVTLTTLNRAAINFAA